MGEGGRAQQTSDGDDLAGALAFRMGLLNTDVEQVKADMDQVKADIKEVKSKPRDRIDQGLRLLGVVTVILGIATAAIEVHRYIEDRAAARKFQITKEILELDRQLSSKEPGLKRDAARLLATIGPDSVRVLVEHLDNPNHETEVYGAIARGLKEILTDNGVAPDKVSKPLIEATSRVMSRELAEGNLVPKTKLLVAHVQALGALGSAIAPAAAERKNIKDLLTTLQTEVQDAQFTDAYLVRNAVQKALADLE